MALAPLWSPDAWDVRPRVASRRVALLDVDPDLGAALTPDRFEAATHELTTSVIALSRGAPDAHVLATITHQDLGLLLIDGVLAREVVLEDTVSTELLGPGDVVRLWAEDGEGELLKQHVRWQVLADARVAVLGRRFARALPRHPEVNAQLMNRVCVRAERLATMQAISHLNSVERRLHALLWHLAERWGRMSTAGVVVPLTLSHRLLGELVGARRPTVSTALAALDRDGKLSRRDDGTWLLTGEPPGTPAEGTNRVVSHRRRLLRDAQPVGVHFRV